MPDPTDVGGNVTPTNDGNASNTTGASNQVPNTSGVIDYNKIQQMIEEKNTRTEDSILKSYFQKQGLSEEEMNSAIETFKTNKAQKEQEANQNNLNLQNENATLKSEILQMKVNEVANQCALEIGIDAKTIPYVIKMADLTTAVNEKGEVSKDTVKEALDKILEDLPQLKPQPAQNNGFSRIGAENNGSQPNMDDVLKNIFNS